MSILVVTKTLVFRGRSRTAATSKMDCFMTIVNIWKPLTIITKRSILDVAAVLDPPLGVFFFVQLIVLIIHFLVLLWARKISNQFIQKIMWH